MSSVQQANIDGFCHVMSRCLARSGTAQNFLPGRYSRVSDVALDVQPGLWNRCVPHWAVVHLGWPICVLQAHADPQAAKHPHTSNDGPHGNGDGGSVDPDQLVNMARSGNRACA